MTVLAAVFHTVSSPQPRASACVTPHLGPLIDTTHNVMPRRTSMNILFVVVVNLILHKHSEYGDRLSSLNNAADSSRKGSEVLANRTVPKLSGC